MIRATATLNCALLLASAACGYPAGISPPSSALAVPAKQADAGSKGEKQAFERVRIAEGEYQVYRDADESGIGPFSPAVYNFREDWVLWRLPDGNLEVEGARHYDSPEGEPHMDAFSVRLSPQFKVLHLTELRKLRWRPDSGPLACDFLPGNLDCSSGAKDPRQNIRLNLPRLHPSYGFLWPVSAFSLGNITRFAERQADHPIIVDMIEVDEPKNEEPVFASVLEGSLSFLGREEIRVAGVRWSADKFELRVPMHPPFLIWTSPQGLLLDFTEEDNQKRLTEHGMKLVRYKQFANF
jgi:hypothetical protein